MLRHHGHLLVVVGRVRRLLRRLGLRPPLVPGGRLFLPDDVVPPVLEEVDECHGGDLSPGTCAGRCRRWPPRPRTQPPPAASEQGTTRPSPSPPVGPEEADERLEPDEAVEGEPDPLVGVVEGVLEVGDRQRRGGGGQGHAGDLRGDVAVEEDPDGLGALDVGREPDQQHADRHQEADRRPEEEGVELELQRQLGRQLQWLDHLVALVQTLEAI